MVVGSYGGHDCSKVIVRGARTLEGRAVALCGPMCILAVGVCSLCGGR